MSTERRPIEYTKSKGIVLYNNEGGEVARYDPRSHLDAESALRAAFQGNERGEISPSRLIGYAEAMLQNAYFIPSTEDKIALGEALLVLSELAISKQNKAGERLLEDIRNHGKTPDEQAEFAFELFKLHRQDTISLARQFRKNTQDIAA